MSDPIEQRAKALEAKVRAQIQERGLSTKSQVQQLPILQDCDFEYEIQETIGGAPTLIVTGVRRPGRPGASSKVWNIC